MTNKKDDGFLVNKNMVKTKKKSQFKAVKREELYDDYCEVVVDGLL